MSFLRNLLLKFLSGVLCTLFFALILNMTLKEVLINGVLYESMKSVLTTNEYSEPNVMDNVTYDENNSIFGNNTIMSEIINSDEVQGMVNEFVSQIMEQMGSNDIDMSSDNQIDVEQKIMDYIKTNRDTLSQESGVEITDEMINDTYLQMKNQNVNKNINDMISSTTNNMNPQEKTMLQGFSLITADSSRNLIIFAIIVDILLIALVTWSYYKWMWSVAWGMISGGLIPIGLCWLVKNIVLKSFNYNVNLEPMLKLSYYVVGTGVVIGVLYVIINSIIMKRRRKAIDDVVPRITNTSA